MERPRTQQDLDLKYLRNIHFRKRFSRELPKTLIKSLQKEDNQIIETLGNPIMLILFNSCHDRELYIDRKLSELPESLSGWKASHQALYHNPANSQKPQMCKWTFRVFIPRG